MLDSHWMQVGQFEAFGLDRLDSFFLFFSLLFLFLSFFAGKMVCGCEKCKNVDKREGGISKLP
jgi:hypothetical protein